MSVAGRGASVFRGWRGVTAHSPAEVFLVRINANARFGHDPANGARLARSWLDLARLWYDLTCAPDLMV